MNKYIEFKQKLQSEIDNFPMFFAFSEKQFTDGLEKLGWEINDLCRIPGGGFIKKSEKKLFVDMFSNHKSHMEKFFETDENLIAAIEYELGNHEFSYTMDPTDTIETLSLDMSDKRVEECFSVARRQYLRWCDENDI